MGKIILNGKEYTGGGISELFDITNKITLRSGITPSSGFGYKAYLNDKIVTLWANGQVSGVAGAGSEYVLFDIDNDILPVFNVANYAFGASSSNQRVQAFTDGTVKVTTGDWMRFQISWFIA